VQVARGFAGRGLRASAEASSYFKRIKARGDIVDIAAAVRNMKHVM
jgi:glutaredoxin-related protein